MFIHLQLTNRYKKLFQSVICCFSHTSGFQETGKWGDSEAVKFKIINHDGADIF